ncbi:hypothetical protein ABZ901_15915 [Actinacidiphila alni]|uniref:hypothetical protein n=1 Tax=Actinacidiphila alni TaxID=380248 RepID=UPI0033F14893
MLRQTFSAAAAVAVAAAVLVGCGKTDSTSSDKGAAARRATVSAGATASPAATRTRPPTTGPAVSQLSFTYHRHSGNDYIDQTLQIHNSDTRSLVPELSFTAVDRHHHVLPGVRVRTAYGSDTGRLVAPYGYSLDILRFSGPGQHQVYDVRVAVRRLSVARQRANIHEVTVQPLNAAGHAVSKFSRFTAVQVSNPDRFAVTIRLAYLVYDQPAPGNTQQATSVTPIGGLVRIPASGTATVQVTGAAAKAVAESSNGPAVSVKTYNSQ